MTNMLICPAADLPCSKAVRSPSRSADIGENRSGESSEKSDEFLPVLENASESGDEISDRADRDAKKKKQLEIKDKETTEGSGAVCAIPADKASPIGWMIALSGEESGPMKVSGDDGEIQSGEEGLPTIRPGGFGIDTEGQPGEEAPEGLAFGEELTVQETTLSELEKDGRVAEGSSDAGSAQVTVQKHTGMERESSGVLAVNPSRKGDTSEETVRAVSGKKEFSEGGTDGRVHPFEGAGTGTRETTILAEADGNASGEVAGRKKNEKYGKGNDPRNEKLSVAVDDREAEGVDPKGSDPEEPSPASALPAAKISTMRMNTGEGSDAGVQVANPNNDQVDEENVRISISSTAPTTMDAGNGAISEKNAPPALERSVENQLFSEIVDKAVLVKNNGRSEFNIALKPEFLGHCRMKISTYHNQVSVRIFTETPMVKEAIEHNIHQLKTDLQNVGLKVDSLDVQVSDDSGRQGRQQGAFAFKREPAKEDADPSGGSRMNDNATPVIPVRNNAQGVGIDYFA